MRHYRQQVSIICITAMLCNIILASGCGGGAQAANPVPAAEMAKQATEITRTTFMFLTKADLDSFAAGTQQLTIDDHPGVKVAFPGTAEDKKHFGERLNAERKANDADRSAFLAGAAVWLVGALLDVVAEQAKKAAKKYSADYTLSRSGLIRRGEAQALEWEAIAVRRDTFMVSGPDATPEYKDNNFCVVYRIAEIPRGVAAPSLYNLTPIYLRDAVPVAKTSVVRLGKPKTTVTLKLTMDAVGVSPTGEAFATKLLEFSFMATRLQVGEEAKSLTLRSDLDKASDMFALPATGTEPLGVNVRLNVVEVDQGYDAKILNAIGDLLDTNKTEIVEIITTPLTGDDE